MTQLIPPRLHHLRQLVHPSTPMAGKFDPNQVQNLVETYWNLLEKIPPRDLKLTSALCATATINDTANCVVVSPVARTKGEAVIIEPVLALFELSSDSSDGEQLAPDCAAYTSVTRVWLALRASGVLIRRDIGDESADVDVATTDGGPVAATLTPGALMTSASATTTKAKVLTLQTNQHPECDKCPPVAAKMEKPKSERYKQAWSISEQYLLERLLIEIPDGDKNRWSKLWMAAVLRVRSRAVYKKKVF
ncbi:hypothetical protein EDB89DRAFT_2246970 [Lactarius sanguifluus]|nr:hypothetical protein EDB89DRAFT_2246970 [Lactarius sanguifluus]